VPIFFSERYFEVVTWGVGHRGLLLRSLHIDHEPRIEIWFKPAYAVCLSSTLDGVHITTRRDPDRLARVEHQLGRELIHTEHLYEVVTRAAPGLGRCWVGLRSPGHWWDRRADHV
jgi:hypothetical protein